MWQARDVEAPPKPITNRRSMMSNVLSGKWKQLRGEIKRQWGKLTDDDFDRIDGDWDKFVGKLQERYGRSRDEADSEARQFFDRMA